MFEFQLDLKSLDDENFKYRLDVILSVSKSETEVNN